MNQKIVKHRIKISTIVFLSLGLIVIIEGFLMMNDFSGVLKNFIKAPIDLIRYFPIIILLYFLTNDVILSITNCNSKFKFSIPKKGIVFIQDYNIWLALFETFSVGKIQTSELKQLRHLKTFSLELDRNIMCVRVILYSKSYKELEKRIKISKPILEVVLPDIEFVSKTDIAKLYNETELLKIGKEYILKEKSRLSYPLFAVFPEKSSLSVSRMVLACNLPENIREEVELMNCVQFYFFHSYDQVSFFKYVNRRFFNAQKETINQFWKIQELQRIILRYQTDKRPFLTFQEGLCQFMRSLSLVLMDSKFVEFGEKQHDYKLINQSYEKKSLNPLDTEKVSSSFEMNQVCSELCNIPKEKNLSHKEKEKRCIKRSIFCQKLLVNDNFSSILENLINQPNKTDQNLLITELRRHLTNKQLICCFSHLSQLNHPRIPYRKLVNLIHALLWSNYKGYKDSNNDKKSVSSMLPVDRNSEQFSPSLSPN
ncbi:MAG: hypothetical protein ACFFAE_01720 [Candidatus Hodarchaeota archaeon]